MKPVSLKVSLTTAANAMLVYAYNESLRSAYWIKRELRTRAVVALCNRSHRATVRRLRAEGRWIGGMNEFGNNEAAS